jgi:peptidoglycan/LPS O-acetylase OafA/YrhL
VIADHLFGYPAGGFVGVDIFFVISGFIITSMLLRQYEQEGRISFAAFYKRRVKRILPASVLVLAVTVAAGFIIFRAGRASTIMTDGIWSAFFAANWRFATTGTDYWADDGIVSPLQHYWSLAVEEQFYFVWPLLIVGTFALAHRLGRPATSSRPVLFAVLAVLSAASFGWALLDTADSPAWAYFSTFSRAWELGLGALLAIASGPARMIPDSIRPAIAWAGLAGIGASFFALNSLSPIPAPGVALPVVSTALVIVAGTGGTQRFLFPLTNRVTGYVGDISFSLYLWHFPAIILLAALLQERPAGYSALVLICTAVLSVASYHLVEDPIRRSSWLEDQDDGRPSRPLNLQRLTYTALGALAVCTVLVLALAPHRTGVSSTPAPVVQPTAGTDEEAGADADRNALSPAIDAALLQEEWPELSPSIDNVIAEGKPSEDEAGCSGVDFSDPESCYFPAEGATRTAVVVGDSTGIMLLPTVREALGTRYNVKGMTRAGCVVLHIESWSDDPKHNAECGSHRSTAESEINALHPDIVFVSTMYGYMDNRIAKSSTTLARAEWQAGAESFIRSIEASGAAVVIVGSPPLGEPLAECGTNFSSPDDCEASISTQYSFVSEAHRAAAAATGATYIDTRRWFCDEDGRCPSFVDGTPVKRDAVHTTRQYAGKIAPLLHERLESFGTDP